MAIAKKYRRKLVVGKRLFVWWVREIQPEDWIGPVLTLASDDKRFLVRSAPRPQWPGIANAEDTWAFDGGTRQRLSVRQVARPSQRGA